MDLKAQASAVPNPSPGKRTKSSVLKSIIPGNHQRKPSPKIDNQPYWDDDNDGKEQYMYLRNQPILPPDHPHIRQHLREDSGNKKPIIAPSKKPIEALMGNMSTLEENQKITRSASFKSIVGMDKEKPSTKRHEKEEENKMKKSKSSTSISAILSRPRSSRGVKAEETHRQKNKENQPPRSSARMEPPPIWAQFATQGFEEPSYATMIPLNDRFAVEDEMALYTPRDYSPSKQRNFQDYQRPTLSRRAESKARPNSECFESGPTSRSFAETMSGLRRSGRDKSRVDISNQQQQTGQAVDTSRQMFTKETRLSERPSSVEAHKVGNDSAGSNLPLPQRGSRVMAAVAAFSGKAKALPMEPPEEPEFVQSDPKAIENAFESLLVSQLLLRLLSRG